MNRNEMAGRSPLGPIGRRETASLTPALAHIGEYDLLYRLGTGGMANVYLARRRNGSGLHRLFAVKAMHAVLSADAEFANMFLDEAHIASQLHHINVVGIVDLGRYAGCLFLVMDYVEGPTLAHLMSSTVERRPALVSAIVIDLLHGLHAAHTLTNDAGEPLDLVHRDVSPSNILVGTDGVARLTDFGIAKARMRRTSTSPGVRKGKLSYSAPEQITKPGNEDARVDVFAAGVVLWNALTGSRLFDGENEASVLLSIISRAIPPPSQVGLHPPACLDRVCLRALSRDPADRYASAAEMADDLRQVTRANDLVAGPEHVAAWVADVFGEELAKRRVAIRATAGGTDPGTASGSRARGTGAHEHDDLDIEYVDLSVSSDAPVSPEAPPARGKRRLAVALLALAACVVTAAGINVYSRNGSEPGSPSGGNLPAEVVPGDSLPGGAGGAASGTSAGAGPAALVVGGAASATTSLTSDGTAGTATSTGVGAVLGAKNARYQPASGQTTSVVADIGGPDPEDALPAEPDDREQTDSKAHRRRKPAPDARRRAAPARAEADASPAEPPVQAPATSEPAPPPPSPETIEPNPYLRRAPRVR